MANLLDNLDKIEDKQCSVYHSDLFNQDFKIYNGNTLVKLPAITKEEALENIECFAKNLPGKSLRSPYFNTESFYEDLNRHQFYNFKTTLGDNISNIHFRTKSNDELTDTILDNMQESFMLREVSESNLNNYLPNELKQTLKTISNDKNLLLSNEQELGKTEDWIKKRYIKHKTGVILDGLRLMESQGLDSKDVLNKLKEIRIFPLIRCSDDLIVNKIQEYLN